MILNTKIIKLDINKKLYETISAKQGDTESRFLLFHIFDSSLPFDLTGKSVRVYGIKPDDKKIFNDLVINDAKKGYCTLELTNQILAIAGLVKLELVIYNGNKKLSSIPFVLNVISSLNSDDAVVSTNEFTALMNGLAALSEYDNYKNEIKEARGGQVNLNKRLDKFNEQLEHIENKIKEVNVIIDLGCKNDGTTDNTVILQNAIEKYKDIGVVLYFPKGTYCHKGLTLYSNISILGENPNNTKLKNISTTNDSIKLIGEGFTWYQEYFIKDIQITSDVITNDTRKGINNKINRNFRYENVKINNHKYGLFETGSWYSQHIMLDIQDCEYGIYLEELNIPGTPNTFTDCILRDNNINMYIGTGTAVLYWNGGHIGSSKTHQIFLDTKFGANTKNITFDTVNFEGGKGLIDVVLGNATEIDGYAQCIEFRNCGFSQWEEIENKIGVDINAHVQNVTLNNCYFIGYSTCIRSNSDYFNKELLLLNNWKNNDAVAYEINGTKYNTFIPICGVNKNKEFHYPVEIEEEKTVDISSLVVLTVGVQDKVCTKFNKSVSITFRTDSTNIETGAVIGNVDSSIRPSSNITVPCVGLNDSGSTIQAYGQARLKSNGDIEVKLSSSCKFLAICFSYNI